MQLGLQILGARERNGMSSMSSLGGPLPPPRRTMSGETKSTHSIFSSASDLFSYDKDALAGEILLQRGESSFEYHELASYSLPSDAPQALKSQLRPGDPVHITHKRLVEETEPARDAFQKAFREGYGLDISVSDLS